MHAPSRYFETGGAGSVAALAPERRAVVTVRGARRSVWAAAGVAAVTLVLTLASLLGTNPYQYGLGDNSITLPFVRAYADPGLYPGDFMVAQRIYYYTYLWKALAWAHVHLGVSIHTLFLGIYAVALFATLLAVHLLARRAFGSTRVAVLAQTFLLFGRPTLAGIDTVERMLNTRELALPLALFACLLYLQRHRIAAFVLLGIGYLIHPLTIHPALAMLVVGALVERPRRDLRALAIGLAAFAALAAPVLAWKFHHTPPSLSLFHADPRWLEALRLRSPHHMFPSEWGVSGALHALVVLGLLGVAWRGAPMIHAGDRRLVAAWTITVLALCALGAVFAEVVPIGAAFVFQPLRSFQFLEFFAILGIAQFVVAGIDRAAHPLDAWPAVVAGCALLYGETSQHRPTLLFLAMVVLLVADRLRWRRLGGLGFALATCVLVGGLGIVLAERAAWRGEDTEFSATNAQDPRWLDVQRWARDHTDRSDAFIVPPDQDDEFRVRSERTVYADWEDGGLMNANPAFGIEWLRRMRALGLIEDPDAAPAFRPMEPDRARRIAAEMAWPRRRVFVVRPEDQPMPAFPVRYQNSEYFVAEVTPAASAAAAAR